MKLKERIKKNETGIKIFSIMLIVFVFWLVFSPATPARTSLSNWFGGINSIFIVMMIIGLIMAITPGSPFSVSGWIMVIIGALLFWGMGLIQNIFATTNPMILLIIGAVVVWWIMRPARPRLPANYY